MNRLAVRSRQAELMDAEDLDQATYAAVLGDLAQVNRMTLSGRPTLGFLRRALRGAARFRLLDVGFGHGDMLRRIARWAAANGVAADLVGIDLNPNSAAVAAAATPPELAIDWRTGDYAGLEGSFDVVLSSFVAHHMSDPQLIAFLRFMEARSTRGWLVNDLHRHRIAHLGFPLLAATMRWHPIVRHDGRLSIARSFRRAEWRELLDRGGMPASARVVRRFPFRLCVERIR